MVWLSFITGDACWVIYSDVFDGFSDFFLIGGISGDMYVGISGDTCVWLDIK